MHKKIRKRDGRYVKFDASKITNAIAHAGKATGEFNGEVAEKLTIKVLNLAEKLYDNKVMTVEQIQDIVEEIILSSPFRRTARSYIIYREQHARLRDITNKMEIDLVDQYLKKRDWKVNENSNMDYSLQGLNNYISSEVSKVYWLNEIYPGEVKKAQADGDFHIHDLSLLSVYCVGWDLYDLLIQGFKGVAGKVESKPAKHLRSALAMTVLAMKMSDRHCRNSFLISMCPPGSVSRHPLPTLRLTLPFPSTMPPRTSSSAGNR